MSDELKACAHCGGAAVVKRGKTVMVSCTQCTASTFQLLDEKDSAIAAWNRRSTSGSASGEVPEALRNWAELSEPEPTMWAVGYEAARRWVKMQLEAKPAEQSATPVPPMDQSSCIPPSRAEPAGQLGVTVADAEKFDAMRAEFDRYMADSFAQALGVSFNEWRKRYIVNSEQSEASRCRAQGGITLISDLIKLWDSQSVSADDHNDEMCRIEEGMRALLATQSASTASGQTEGTVLTDFMAWATDNLGQGYSLEREDGTFLDPVTRWAFAAWRARDRQIPAQTGIQTVPVTAGTPIAALSKENP